MPSVNPCCIQVLWLLVLWSSAACRSCASCSFDLGGCLRPAMGCYGDPLAKTPHMDRLASRGRLFQKAYCNQAVCGPSRASMMTGRLPDHIRVWHNRDRFRDHQPDLLTLPQYFQHHGYRTVSLGKVFSGNARELDPISWSEPEILQQPGWTTYRLKKPGGPPRANLPNRRRCQMMLIRIADSQSWPSTSSKAGAGDPTLFLR